MKKYFANYDWGMIISLLILLVLSLTIIKSVAPSLFTQQLIYSLFSLPVFFIFSQIDYRLYARFDRFFYLISILGLVLTFVFGAVTRGSIRWIQIGGFTVQPSELVKPFLIISFASFFISRPIVNFKSSLINFLFLFLPIMLIFFQPDLGSTIVVFLFWLGIAIAAGIPKRLIAGLGLFAAVLFPLGWLILQPYQKERIFSFLNPFSDPLGSGYNMIQAMVAVGSGQWFGRGLGRGTQSHLMFLPERHTDFIFASLAEELGFLGGFLLIIIYAFLLWRLLKIAGLAKEKYGALICLGVFSMIFAQVFINIGMNLGLVPVTGITLPLISSGGSSLFATVISLGIIQNISRAKNESQQDID